MTAESMKNMHVYLTLLLGSFTTQFSTIATASRLASTAPDSHLNLSQRICLRENVLYWGSKLLVLWQKVFLVCSWPFWSLAPC